MGTILIYYSDANSNGVIDLDNLNMSKCLELYFNTGDLEKDS